MNPNAEIFFPKLDVFSDFTGTLPLNSVTSPHNPTAVNNIHDSSSSYTILKNLRLKNNNRIIFGHININSIRNKFDMISDLVKGSIDILLISETKIDDTFPTSQFSIPGFSSPYRLDRCVDGSHGGGLLLYCRTDIPTKKYLPKCLVILNLLL